MWGLYLLLQLGKASRATIPTVDDLNPTSPFRTRNYGSYGIAPIMGYIMQDSYIYIYIYSHIYIYILNRRDPVGGCAGCGVWECGLRASLRGFGFLPQEERLMAWWCVGQAWGLGFRVNPEGKLEALGCRLLGRRPPTLKPNDKQAKKSALNPGLTKPASVVLRSDCL